jgi:dihydroorotate dehydrogenase
MKYQNFRSLLFRCKPELSHDISLALLQRLGRFYPNVKQPNQRLSIMGLDCINRLGLAAGFDKNAQGIKHWHRLGLGWIEIGTVTPLPQKGHSKPRLFRLPGHLALINHMGFNNIGVEALVDRLRTAMPIRCCLGINIGKGKQTPLSNALDDYTICMRKLYPFADYLAMNISSPNTPELRQLQTQAFLSRFITHLTQIRLELSKQYGKWVPILIKFSPDETQEIYRAMVHEINDSDIEGVIVTNTTVHRPAELSEYWKSKVGGLSGAPLTQRSNEILHQVKQQLLPKKIIFSSGGVMSKEIIQARFDAGADVVQLYTGLIYQGPGWIKQLLQTLPGVYATK